MDRLKGTTRKAEKPREKQKQEVIAASKARGLRLGWDAPCYRAEATEGHRMGLQLWSTTVSPRVQRLKC